MAPKPSCTPHPRRISVKSWHQARADNVGEHPTTPAAWNFRVELSDIAHATPKHDDFRVEEIDDLRLGPSQAVAVADHAGPRDSISRPHGPHDQGSSELFSRVSSVIHGEAVAR